MILCSVVDLVEGLNILLSKYYPVMFSGIFLVLNICYSLQFFVTTTKCLFLIKKNIESYEKYRIT